MGVDARATLMAPDATTLAALEVLTDLPWLVQPNHGTFEPFTAAPDPLVTAVMVVLVHDGHILFADVASRGLDLPGGHRERDEEISEVGTRELWEESGLLVEDLAPLAVLHVHIDASKPTGYRYPYPDSWIAFLGWELIGERPVLAPRAEGEIASALWMPIDELLHGWRNRCWAPLLDVLFGDRK